MFGFEDIYELTALLEMKQLKSYSFFRATNMLSVREVTLTMLNHGGGGAGGIILRLILRHTFRG